MWKQGIFKLGGFIVNYEMKVYDKGSQYGILGGRISKLRMSVGTVEIISYDRGWVIKPINDIARQALIEIVCNESLLEEEK